MSKRNIGVLGAVAAAGAGYYLYAAGGDPKVAQKKIKGNFPSHVLFPTTNLSQPTADAAEAQAKLKSEVPGKEKEYEKKGEALASQAGQKFDKAV
jgi:hypothetical protein